jgi:hypothetical protein
VELERQRRRAQGNPVTPETVQVGLAASETNNEAVIPGSTARKE